MEFLKKILKTLCISENDESINRKRCLDDESDSQSNKKVKFEPVWKPQNNSFESNNDNHNNDNNDTIDSIKTMLNPTTTSDSEKELKINRNNSGLEGFVVVN